MTLSTLTDPGRVSFVRQLDIFDPATFRESCHVVGTGAIGSHIAETLVRLGVPRIELYDADVVRALNVPCGAFVPADVGRPKVEALAERFAAFPQTRIVPHTEAVGESHVFSGVVFVCVDSMDARRMMWEHCLKLRPTVPLVIESRIGPQQGLIFTVDPTNLVHIRAWEEASAYPSGHVASLPCTNRAVATTITVVAGLAVHQLVLWHAGGTPQSFLSIGLQGQPLLQTSPWTL